jgi:hypothetical protein
MSSFTPTVRRRLGGGLVLASAAALVIASLSSVPAGAAVTGSSAGCPTLTVDNPAPGAQLNPGKLIVSGAAFDPGAPSGPGVSRVDFFYGHRETGGKPLGTAIPGETNVSAPGQTGGSSSRLGGFSVQLDFGDISRGDNLVAYAYSSSSGAVTTVSIPVLVGVQATSTPTGDNTPVVPRATTSSTGCSGGGVAAVSQPAAAQQPAAPSSGSPAAAPAPAVAPAAVTGATGDKPVLRVENPRAGDLVVVGDTVIHGIAFDPAAPAGTSGVDQVVIFAGLRDAGGRFLGSGGTGAGGNPEAFAIQVNVNLNQSGAHTLSCYAHSSVTGQEAVVSVPIFLGAPPTATPR